MSIIPIPATRISDLMVGQRLTSQLQADQLDLLRLQNAISTGQRITLPSEDPLSALRAINLQSLLERKGQIKTNLQASQSYLTATDSALSSASSVLNDARATALGAAGTTVTDDQRAAAATQINRAIEQLVNIGNQNFRGRYLFGGTRTDVSPFINTNGLVGYSGNESAFQSYSNLSALFESSISGQEAFGALSEPVRGSANLNPRLTDAVKIKDLNGGLGVRLGSIVISDGSQSSTIDLTSAETVGDVASLIQDHAPPGRIVTVDITPTGLNISLDSTGGGNLSINEVGGGNAASDLGILQKIGSSTGPVVGGDLNPRLQPTTPLADLLGSRAFAKVNSANLNNNLRFEAVQRGLAYNGVTVQFVDNATITPGHETVAYDGSAHTLTFQIDAGNTSANDIVSALNNDPVAGAVFRASLAADDTDDAAFAGTGKIDVAATGLTAAGSGLEPDLTSGLRINNGGQDYTIDLSSAHSVEDLLNLLNGSNAGVVASLNTAGTGIDVRSRLSGGDFSIGENGGSTATHLGLRTFTATTHLSDLNHGLGVHENTGEDFIIRRKDGTQLTFDVSTYQTVNDVINAINSDPANLNPATKVTARLATNGNGIELTTSDASTAATFAVLKVNNSQAAEDLGLIPAGQSQSSPPVASGGTETITGRDTNPAEVESAFNALVRLRQALQSNDQVGLQRALSLLDNSTTQLNAARAEVGARQQTLDDLAIRNEDETTDLKSALSTEIDTDLTQASVDLIGRQTAYQAALQVAGQMAKLTLLDYL